MKNKILKSLAVIGAAALFIGFGQFVIADRSPVGGSGAAQSPWTGNIDAGNNSLSNVSGVTVSGATGVNSTGRGGINAATSTNLFGSSVDASGIGATPYMPNGNAPAHDGELIISNAQSGTPFTKGGTGTLSYDTSNFFVGTTSAKIVTDGAGGTATVKLTSLTPTFNMQNRRLSIWFMVSSNTSVSKIWLYASSDNLNANFYTFKLQSLINTTKNESYIQANQWIHVTVDLDANNISGGFVKTGNPNWNAINSVQVAVADDAATPFTLWVGKISTVPKMPQAIISFSFDDGWLSQYTKAMPLLNAAGIPATIYTTDTLTAPFDPNHLTLPEMSSMQQNGWEIACHPNATHYASLSTTTQIQNTNECKTWLQTNGFYSGIGDFAYVFGEQTPQAQQILAENEDSGRGAFAQWTDSLPPDNPYLIRSLLIPAGSVVATSTIKAVIADAIANHEWLVLYAHDIDGATLSDDVGSAELQELIAYATSTAAGTNTKFMTVHDALQFSQGSNSNVSSGPSGTQVTSPFDTVGWNDAYCDKMSNTGGSSASSNLCGSFSFNINTTGTFTSHTGNGYAYDGINEAAALPSTAVMFNYGTVSGGAGWMFPASTTPIMQTTARIDLPQNSTTTTYRIGFVSTATTGSVPLTTPASGCWFEASSTAPDWYLESSNASAITQADTLVASSTNITSTGAFMRFKLAVDAGSCIGYIQTSDLSPWNTTSIYTNVPATVGLNAMMTMITSATGGLANALDFFHTHIWWKDVLPSL